jgi:RNA polymerase sigma factor (sigma-70 family)
MTAARTELRPVITPAIEPIRTSDPVLSGLVRAALAGDDRAFAKLVARFERPLRSIVRSYRLSGWDADDVIQSTWMQFLEHGAGLREPAAISGWLATTARRYCLRMLQSNVRELLLEDPTTSDGGYDGRLDADLLAAERRAALDASLARLTGRQRDLITLLLDEPELSYEEVGQRLGLPIGSIGPTRARSLSRLRRDGRLRALA